MKSAADIIVILGPTACGKTELACSLAKELDGEIISADSRQVYRHMNIGTGKDIEEYEIDGISIPHHLVDIHDPGYRYNIGEFLQDFGTSYSSIVKNGKKPLLCGGSGLYIETALKGTSFIGIPSDSEFRKLAEKLSESDLTAIYQKISDEVKSTVPADTNRRIIRAIEIANYLKTHPDFKPIEALGLSYQIIGLDIDRDLRRDKISRRLKHRLENGMIEEVEFLLEKYLKPDDLEYYGLEYKFIGRYLDNQLTRKELYEKLNVAIHQFAKRQMTWFRRMERNGYAIQWIDASMSTEAKIQKAMKIIR
ncbi:tRNA (adenosine(37)-N6)-dimethylallyltransferase MiaA [Crocinitomix catalasitica]|nr:tRNA (adenosine(37)-N6)-dimethylallyltransferase MiaA [Crocinitomix catalasitica]